MLWQLLKDLLCWSGVTESDGFHEVRVLDGAVWTRYHVTVVAVEVESLHRVQQQLKAIVTLESREREMVLDRIPGQLGLLFAMYIKYILYM